MTTIDTPRLDEAVLEQFVNQAVGDLAAAISGLMVHLGDRLGLYRAMAGAGPMTPADAGRAHRHRRAVRPRVAEQPGGRRLRHLRPGRRHLRARRRSRRWCSPTRARCSSPAPSRPSPPATSTTTRSSDAFTHRRGHRLGRARRAAAHRRAAAVPLRLRGQPGAVLAPRPRRGGGQAARRGQRGRRRLRLRRLHGHHGPGVRAVDLPRASTTTKPSIAAARARPRRPASPDGARFEVATASDVPGTGYDLVMHVRLPARHGRPGRRRPPDPRGAGRRRHPAAGRARGR